MRGVLVAAALLFATPTWALDFNQELMDDERKPICVKEVKDECPVDSRLTLAVAVRNALLNPNPAEQPVPDGVEKDRRGALASRVRQEPSFEPTSEERVLMKKLVGLLYGPLVVHAVWVILK